MDINRAVEMLKPFGRVSETATEEGCVFDVIGRAWSIRVTFDECSSPRFEGFDHGVLVMDTRDDLEACLAVFNDL